MIRRYRVSDVIALLAFLKSNPQMNIMFEANVVNKKNYAYECHLSEENGVISTVIISQREVAFIKLTEASDLEEITEFLKLNSSLSEIKGSSADIDAIAPYFNGAQKSVYHIGLLEEPPVIFNCDYKISIADGIKDLRELYRILKDNGLPPSVSFDEFYMIKRESIIELKSRSYLAFDDTKVIGTASTLYEILPDAFLGSVATDIEYRNKGIAKAAVSLLCKTLFKEGFKNLYIAYSDPAAQKVYSDIGFKEIMTCKTLR